MEKLWNRSKWRRPVVAALVAEVILLVYLFGPIDTTRAQHIEERRSADATPSRATIPPGAERLWPGVDVPASGLVEAIDLGAGSDLIEWRPGMLRRRGGRTGAPVWEKDRGAASRRDVAVDWPDRPPWDVVRSDPSSAKLVRPAPDLDGDGTGDLVWVSRRGPCVLALAGGAGGKGRLIWSYAAQPGAVPGPESAHVGRAATPLEGWVTGMPALTEIDGDGVPDLIVTFVVKDSSSPSAFAGWVDALSGRAGRPLWRHVLKDVHAPEAILPAALISLEGKPSLSVFAGAERVILEAATGHVGKIRFHHGFLPVRPPQYVDLDGDGEPEMLAVTASRLGGQGLSVHHLIPPYGFWGVAINAWPSDPALLGSPRSSWPVVADLDTKQRGRDLLMPDGWNRGVRVINGTNGQTRWERPLRSEAESNNPSPVMVEGPDLDGDGIREVFAASFFWNQHRPLRFTLNRRDPAGLYVDAFSGRDGRPIWLWHQPLRETSGIRSHLQWWHCGPDGWPLLVVAVGHGRWPLASDDQAAVFLLTAGAGRPAGTIEGLCWPNLADFDGDGQADLWGTISGKVHAYRGAVPAVMKPPRALSTLASRSLADDPRFWRRLPWVRFGTAEIPIATTVVLLAGLVWILPVRLVRRALRDVPGKHSLWKALPLACAIVAATYLILPPDRIHSLFLGVGVYEMLLVMIVLVPVLILGGWLISTKRVRVRGRLSLVMALALAVGLVEMGYLISAVTRPAHPAAAGRLAIVGYLVVAALGVPIVVLGEELVSTVTYRNARRLARLLGLILAFALFIGLAMLAADAGNREPAVSYAWDRWYELFYPGAYGAGVVLTVKRIFKSLYMRHRESVSPEKSKDKSDDLAEI